MTQLHEIKVPFHYWGCGEDNGYAPGCEHIKEDEYTGHVDGEPRYHEAGYYVASDWGHMLITEIQRTSVPGFEDRIFYTRRWRDPLGNEFGKSNLRCKGARAFKQMLKGWRHTFYMDGQLVDPRIEAASAAKGGVMDKAANNNLHRASGAIFTSV